MYLCITAGDPLRQLHDTRACNTVANLDHLRATPAPPQAAPDVPAKPRASASRPSAGRTASDGGEADLDAVQVSEEDDELQVSHEDEAALIKELAEFKRRQQSGVAQLYLPHL